MVKALDITPILPVYAAVSKRLESFESFTLKGDSKTIMAWPYDSPSAESMAKLGFFFQPTKKLNDRIKCFCCKKLQSNWKTCENPTDHHLSKHPTCWFSRINQYLEQKSKDPDFNWDEVDLFNDPLGEKATQTRRESFAKLWPFDSIKEANPISDKMVEAGFYYISQEDGDDLATCIYCGTSLEGWENDDNPLIEHQKRAKEKGCYFLDCLQNMKNKKRQSLDNEIDQQLVKKSKSNKDASVVSIDSSINTTRPRSKRKAAQNLHLSDLFNESDESDDFVDFHAADESFGLSAHDIELNSEEAQYESSQRSHKINKSASTLKNSSKPNSSVPNSSKTIISPVKKSKFLDSSFNNKEDLFSSKNLKNANISKLSPVKPINELKKATALNDITNMPQLQFEKSFKESINSNENESESDSEYHSTNAPDSSEDDNDDFKDVIDISDASAVQNTQQNTVQDHDSTTSINNLHKSASEILEQKEEESDNDSIILVSNSKEIIMNSSVDQSSSTVRHSPFKTQKSLNQHSKKASPEISLKKALSHELLNSKAEESQFQTSNKSILTQPRFIESPGIKRSRSPFLDDDYKGSDDISIPESPIALDDIPIEESTDHNINVQIQSIEAETKLSNSMNSLISHKTTQNVSIEEDKHNSDNDSYHSVEEEDNHEQTPSKPQIFTNEDKNTWLKPDIEKIFNKFEDLETAKEYLFELSKIPYELNDDIDGRVSYFINEMPDDELNMTIEEWLNHSAEQGKIHFEEICCKMIQDYDDECEKALTILKNLPVE